MLALESVPSSASVIMWLRLTDIGPSEYFAPTLVTS